MAASSAAAPPLEAQLREVWIETGRAGVDKVYGKAVRKGLAVTRKQVQEFVKSQASAQVFQPRARSDGRVVATRALMTWQVDVMDMKQFDAKANKGYKFVLVAVDVFDRTMKAAPMKTKTPEEMPAGSCSSLASWRDLFPNAQEYGACTCKSGETNRF